MPGMPRNLRSLAGMAPSPISVFVQGKPSRSANSRNSAEALAIDHATAGIDVRPPRLRQQLHGLADAVRRGLWASGCRRASRRSAGIRTERSGPSRPWARPPPPDRGVRCARCGRPFSSSSKITHIAHKEVVLADGACNADRIALLERIEPDSGSRHLSGDDDHWGRIHECGGDAGHGVGHPGAGGDDDDTHLAGRTRVAVGSVHGALLVPHKYVLDGVLPMQRVVDVQNRSTGVAPEALSTPSACRQRMRMSAPRSSVPGGAIPAAGSSLPHVFGGHVHGREPRRISLTKSRRCTLTRPREVVSVRVWQRGQPRGPQIRQRCRRDERDSVL